MTRCWLPIIGATLFGCMAPTQNGREVQTLLADGKTKLMANEWRNAQASFQQVLNDYDGENAEAHFGIALAEVAALSDIARYVGAVVERASDGFSILAGDDESRYLVELVGAAIDRFRQKFAAADRHLQAALADPDFHFQIDALPIFLDYDNRPSFDMGGEWDAADAALLRAATQTLLALLHGAASVDLRFDFTRAHAYLTQLGFDSGNYLHLLNWLVYVLNDAAYPQFLSLKAEEGESLLQASRLALAAATRSLAQALSLAANEVDDQSDDILRYNGNQAGLALFAAAEPQFCDATLAAGRAGFSLLDFEIGDSSEHPQLTRQLLCLLQKLEANLGWRDDDAEDAGVRAHFDAQPRINVLHDLMPQVDAFAAALVRSQPRLLGGIPLPEGLLQIAAETYLGDSIELDPSAFFYADASGLGGNIRGLLPKWQNAPCPATGLCGNAFLLELECSPLPATQTTFPLPLTLAVSGDDLPLCKSAWLDAGQSQDSPHFNEGVAADAFVGIVPYVAMQSPSLHDVLWLDLAALGQRYSESDAAEDMAIVAALNKLDANLGDFSLPTLQEFNAFGNALLSNSTIGGLLRTTAESFE